MTGGEPPEVADAAGAAAAPEEIAESAAWLLSDCASYMTGVVLPVTGGTGTAVQTR